MQLRPEHHRQRTCHSRTRHQCWNHTNRITRCERNCAFGHECDTEYRRCTACFALFFREAVFEQIRGQSHAQRRRHTSSHHGCHGRIHLAGEQTHGKGISRFIHRTTHIERHHRTKNQAEHQCAGGLHAGQPCGHGFEQARYRHTDHVEHDQTDHQCTDQRQYEHRF